MFCMKNEEHLNDQAGSNFAPSDPLQLTHPLTSGCAAERQNVRCDL